MPIVFTTAALASWRNGRLAASWSNRSARRPGSARPPGARSRRRAGDDLDRWRTCSRRTCSTNNDSPSSRLRSLLERLSEEDAPWDEPVGCLTPGGRSRSGARWPRPPSRRCPTRCCTCCSLVRWRPTPTGLQWWPRRDAELRRTRAARDGAGHVPAATGRGAEPAGRDRDGKGLGAGGRGAGVLESGAAYVPIDAAHRASGWTTCWPVATPASS